MRPHRNPTDPPPGVRLAGEAPGRALQRQADQTEAVHGTRAAAYAANLRRIAAELAAQGAP